MSDSSIEITRVGQEAETLLTNLFELYLHDMAEWFRFETLHEDGRYHYDMAVHWERGDEAYLLRVNGQPAGFTLIGDGEPHGGAKGSHDVDEFFVTRRYRHEGVAQRLAGHVWDLHKGGWSVRALEANLTAVPFWRRTIRAYTGGSYSEELHIIEEKYHWKHFRFTS